MTNALTTATDAGIARFNEPLHPFEELTMNLTDQNPVAVVTAVVDRMAADLNAGIDRHLAAMADTRGRVLAFADAMNADFDAAVRGWRNRLGA